MDCNDDNEATSCLCNLGFRGEISTCDLQGNSALAVYMCTLPSTNMVVVVVVVMVVVVVHGDGGGSGDGDDGGNEGRGGGSGGCRHDIDNYPF